MRATDFSSRRNQLASYLASLRELVPHQLGVALALAVLVGALEFVSLALLPALFHATGFARSAPPTNWQPFDLAGHSVGVLVAGFALLRVGQIALGAWRDVLATDLETQYVAALRERFYRAMHQADWLFLTRQRSSDFNQALLEEIPRVGPSLRHALNAASAAILGAVQTCIAFAIAPGFTLAFIAAACAVALAWRFMQRQAVRSAGIRERANLAAAVSEHIGGMKIAKSYGRSEGQLGEFRRALDSISAAQRRGSRVGALMNFCQQAAVFGALAIFAYVALVARPLGLPSLVLLGYVFFRLFGLAMQFQAGVQNILVALPSFQATENLRLKLLAVAEPAATAAAPALPLARELRFSNVSFRYHADRAPALADIDLVLPARQATALCGSSGAGKSTFADLALGLLRPESGQILIDGQPLASDRIHAWRQSIGYVPQETFLFHDTVRANLLWARPDASPAELQAALRAAAAEEFVQRLPQGLDTVLGDRGQRLSGGERQRLALARALLRRPALLVLDEATSSLDPHNERLVQDAISRLHGETTILLIAHRLSTVRAADRIVVLSAGRVAESGTWEELAAREHGAFRALLNADART